MVPVPAPQPTPNNGQAWLVAPPSRRGPGETSATIHRSFPGNSFPSSNNGALAAVLPLGGRRRNTMGRMPPSLRQPQTQETASIRPLAFIGARNANKGDEKNPVEQALQQLQNLGKQIKSGKLPDNILVNSAIRSTVYATLVHWLYTSRINSISAGDALPNLARMSARGLVPCALRTGMEYAAAMGIEKALNHLLPKPAPNQKPNPLMPVAKTVIAACPATALSLMTERFNQHLILGKTPQQAFMAITANPQAVGDALRGFPVAALGLAIMLTIQNSQQQPPPQTLTGEPTQAKSYKGKAGSPPVALAPQPPKNGNHKAALSMAALGSVGGLVDYTIGNAQLRGISSAQAFQEMGKQSPTTLAAYSLLGAATLALFQSGIDQARQHLTEPKEQNDQPRNKPPENK